MQIAERGGALVHRLSLPPVEPHRNSSRCSWHVAQRTHCAATPSTLVAHDLSLLRTPGVLRRICAPSLLVSSCPSLLACVCAVCPAGQRCASAHGEQLVLAWSEKAAAAASSSEQRAMCRCPDTGAGESSHCMKPDGRLHANWPAACMQQQTARWGGQVLVRAACNASCAQWQSLC